MFPVIFLFVFLSFLCASTGSHPPMRREQPGEAYSNIEAILESNSSRSSNQEPIRPIMVRDTQTSGSSHSSRLGEPDFIPVTESRFPDANLKMKLNLDCKRFFSLESEHDLSILMSKMSLRGRNWTDLTLLEECRDAFVPRCHLLRSKHIEEILDPKAIDQKENLIPEDDRVRLRFERLFQIGCAQKIVPWSAVSSQKHFDMVKNVLRVDLISNWINFKPKMLTSLICHQIKDRINRGDTTAFELPPINSEDYASYDKLSALFILMRLIVPDIHIWPYILTPDIISFVSRARSEDCCSHLSEMLLQLASEINEPSSKLIIKFPIIFFKQILSRKFSSFDFFRKFVTKLASMDWLSENQPIYILSYLKAFADARIPLGNQSIILADIFKYSDIIFSTEMNLFMTDDSGDCSQYQTLYWKTFIPSPNGKLAHVQLSSQESRNSQSLASSSSSIQDIDMNQTPESIGTDYSVFQKVIRDSINSATALALKDIKRSEELKRFLEGFGSIYSAPQDVDNWIEQEIQDTEIQIYSIPSSSIYPSSALRWLSKLSALLHGLFIKLGNSPNLPPNFLFHDWGELDSAQIFDHVTDLIDDRKTSFLYVNYVIIQLHVSRLTKTISNNQETKKTIFEGLVRQLNTFKNNNGNQWPLMPAACVLAQTEADFRQLVIKRHPVIKNMTYFHIDMRQSSSHSDDDPQFSHSREPRIIAPIEFYVERTMLQLVTNEIIFAHPWTILHVDGAIDQGGPLRGWLSDMLTYMADPENKIIISLSDTDLITRKFAWMVDPTVGFFCGAIISKAIQKGVSSYFYQLSNSFIIIQIHIILRLYTSYFIVIIFLFSSKNFKKRPKIIILYILNEVEISRL